MTETEMNALQIEEVVETAKVVEKPKKTSTKKTTKKETAEVKEETVVETETEGEVVDCYFLRLRSEPVVADNVVKEIKVGTKVKIVETTDNGFYKVKTEHGDEGFCMVDFIKK